MVREEVSTRARMGMKTCPATAEPVSGVNQATETSLPYRTYRPACEVRSGSYPHVA